MRSPEGGEGNIITTITTEVVAIEQEVDGMNVETSLTTSSHPSHSPTTTPGNNTTTSAIGSGAGTPGHTPGIHSSIHSPKVLTFTNNNNTISSPNNNNNNNIMEQEEEDALLQIPHDGSTARVLAEQRQEEQMLLSGGAGGAAVAAATATATVNSPGKSPTNNTNGTTTNNMNIMAADGEGKELDLSVLRGIQPPNQPPNPQQQPQPQPQQNIQQPQETQTQRQRLGRRPSVGYVCPPEDLQEDELLQEELYQQEQLILQKQKEEQVQSQIHLEKEQELEGLAELVPGLKTGKVGKEAVVSNSPPPPPPPVPEDNNNNNNGGAGADMDVTILQMASMVVNNDVSGTPGNPDGTIGNNPNDEEEASFKRMLTVKEHLNSDDEDILSSNDGKDVGIDDDEESKAINEKDEAAAKELLSGKADVGKISALVNGDGDEESESSSNSTAGRTASSNGQRDSDPLVNSSHQPQTDKTTPVRTTSKVSSPNNTLSQQQQQQMIQSSSSPVRSTSKSQHSSKSIPPNTTTPTTNRDMNAAAISPTGSNYSTPYHAPPPQQSLNEGGSSSNSLQQQLQHNNNNNPHSPNQHQYNSLHHQSSNASLSTATQSHDVRMPMYLPTFRPATGCTNASDFIVRCFVARLRSGITVVKHGRSRWCKSRLRILHLHSDGRSLSWKPAQGEPSSSKRPPKLDLSTCNEVRHAWSPDPQNPMFTGTPILRQKCEASNAFKSFALVFSKRTVDITAVTADQCKVLMEGFSALCFRLQVANLAGNYGTAAAAAAAATGNPGGVGGGVRDEGTGVAGTDTTAHMDSEGNEVKAMKGGGGGGNLVGKDGSVNRVGGMVVDKDGRVLNDNYNDNPRSPTGGIGGGKRVSE